MNIEIITSINADLKETGFGSALACHDVLGSVARLGHSVRVTECGSMDHLNDVLQRRPDLVILAAKYMPVEAGEDVWFSEYFSQHHITFSGSIRETLRYDSDKVRAKIRLSGLGIKTAKYFTAIPGQYACEESLPFSFPLFLKPMDAANGNGVDEQSLVKHFHEFEDKVLSLYAIYQQPVLVEEYLAGREFTVAVIESDSGKLSVSAIELVPPVSTGTLRILGAAVKKNDTESLQAISKTDRDAVTDMAASCFQGLSVRGFGRIDVKMDAAGICYFMEANLVPGMNRLSSYFPRACGIANQMTYDNVIHQMLDESFGRATAKQASNEPPEQGLAS